MKAYYLIAEQRENLYFVHVTDRADGTVLMQIPAESYSEAVKKVCFSVRSMGVDAICGVGADGKPYAEVV